MTILVRRLKAIGACEEAVVWAKNYKTLRSAWKSCERGDWMLWLCANMQGKKGWPTRQQIVLVCCDCAELSLKLFEDKYANDKRPRLAIEAVRKWANGEGTIEDVRSAATSAAYATSPAAAASAAAAYAAAATAATAAYASAAYATSPAAAAAYAASAARLRECADICRKQLKIPASIGASK
jgi:hypothetical protein